MTDEEPIKAPRGLCRYCGLPRFCVADLRRYAREQTKQNKQRRQKYDPPWARAICWMAGGPHPKRSVKVENLCEG